MIPGVSGWIAWGLVLTLVSALLAPKQFEAIHGLEEVGQIGGARGENCR